MSGGTVSVAAGRAAQGRIGPPASRRGPRGMIRRGPGPDAGPPENRHPGRSASHARPAAAPPAPSNIP
jgi:hypothetical protein